MMDRRYSVENPETGSRRATHTGLDHSARTGLHVPDAPHRPGDEPRFSRFSQQPGDLDRPAANCKAEQLHDHAHGLVRVLTDECAATGPWNPQLSVDQLRAGLRQMMLTRAMDRRMLTMQRQGRLSFYVESRGEEAVSVGAGMALSADDLLFPAYRQQGLLLTRGVSVEELACQCIGNGHEPSGGRQMPVHYSSRKANFVSISSPVGTQFPQAVGAAMATAYRREKNIVASWIGDGTAAQGDFHYALNFASVYLPPVVLNVVNNQWAISTHCNLATGGPTFAARAQAYGLPGIRVDGNDLLAVYAVTKWAAERAMSGAGPTLIELLTYRAAAHSSSDDPGRYRPGDEARLWPGGDPIERLANYLILQGEWSEDREQELDEKLDKEVVTAFRSAEARGKTGEMADPAAALFDDVYAKQPPHLRKQREEFKRLKQKRQSD